VVSEPTDPGAPAFHVPPVRRRRWPWVLLALAVLAGGGVWASTAFGGSDSCGKGVTRIGPQHECIGVTDGSVTFMDALGPVMDKIRTENQRVEHSGAAYVSIAYVEPISSDLAAESTKYGVREELEGAYLAQRRLNDPRLGGHGDTPQIRLLVGNIGLRSAQWKPLTDQLIAMAHGSDHLVAVAGLGQSWDSTLDAVNALRAARIPMMGATVTADDLASATEVGFFRISAPNSAQAGAAVNYLRQQQEKTPGYTVQVVRDRNTDDIYNTSLYSDFMAAAERRGLALAGGDLQYVSGVSGVNNAFSAVADRVCDKKPKAVYFAGRGADLRGFVTAMSAPDRRCPVTVLTGDDALGVYFDSSAPKATVAQFAANWTDSRVTVLYTALGHPELPARVYDSRANPFPAFADLAHREFGKGPAREFQDGQAILAHDAVWTLGLAVRAASGGGSAAVNPGSLLNALVSSDSVDGVSGPTQFGPDGNPKNKAMALVQLQPDGLYDFRTEVYP
jgi:ABC-type branched-subunit amino acid transport system substrate-binding protein